MSTLRISNIEAKSVPASATIDEKVKITNSSGDTLVFLDGKTSGITTVGINTTDGNITFDANSNVVVTGIITATRFSGQITPTSLEIGSNIKLGNAGVITATSFVGSGANLTSLPSQLTLSNNADNRVITGGSGTNLNGESTLTFDGNTLQNLQSGAAANLTLKATSNSFNSLILDSNRSANTQFGIIDGRWNGNIVNRIQFVTGSDGTNKDDGYMAFHTRTSGASLTERLRIASTGNVSINTTNVTEGVLQVNGDITAKELHGGRMYGMLAGRKFDGNNALGGYAIEYASGYESPYIVAYNNTGSPSINNITFGSLTTSDRNLNTGLTKLVEINANSGNTTLKTGNLVVGTSGRGIDFSATSDGSGTDSSELLDDYEEGSWTPTIISGASSISVSSATYTKVGRLVHVQIRYNSLSSTNGSQFKIGGLPYTAGSVGHYTTAVMHDGWDFAGSQEPVPTLYMSANNAHFVFYYSRTAGQGWAAVSGSDTNGQGAIFSWCYHSTT